MMKFSAKDKDQEEDSRNCAQVFTGAFWYDQCLAANINGQYLNGENNQMHKGITWYHFRGSYYSLKTSQMKFRPDYIKFQKFYLNSL